MRNSWRRGLPAHSFRRRFAPLFPGLAACCGASAAAGAALWHRPAKGGAPGRDWDGMPNHKGQRRPEQPVGVPDPAGPALPALPLPASVFTIKLLSAAAQPHSRTARPPGPPGTRCSREIQFESGIGRGAWNKAAVPNLADLNLGLGLCLFPLACLRCRRARGERGRGDPPQLLLTLVFGRLQPLRPLRPLRVLAAGVEWSHLFIGMPRGAPLMDPP